MIGKFASSLYNFVRNDAIYRTMILAFTMFRQQAKRYTLLTSNKHFPPFLIRFLFHK